MSRQRNRTFRRWPAVWLAAATLATFACSSPTADVTAPELEAVVESDAIIMDGDAIPDAVVDRLVENRVVLLGETHHLREHWEFVATLMAELYEHGFRQLLIEAPHMAAWLIDDYVQGSPQMPGWSPPPFYDRRLTAIRDLNQTAIARNDPIHVRGIDANESWYGGAGDFHLLLGWFADTLPTGADPLESFLGGGYVDADTPEQRRAVEELIVALEADRDDLVDSWGRDGYEQLVGMLTVERASIDVRATRAGNDDDGARAREDLIKQLVEQRIADCPCGTVINIGAHHAQKAHLMGTEQEWLGAHLVNNGAVDGSVIVIGFASAATELEPGAGGTPWDVVRSNSPDNEVFRVLAETLPDHTVFLPLDDPLFAERTVAYNSEDVIYATPLKQQFDALVQYGRAHRMPVD